MVGLNVTTQGSFSGTVQGLLDMIAPAGKARLNKVASRDVLTGVKRYHREYDSRGGWRKGGGGGSLFGEEITRAWSVERADSEGVTVVNAGRYFRQKVEGGRIRPKRAPFLTIPLVPEAKGRLARVYEQVTGNKLFKNPRKTVLMANTSSGLKAIYAIKDEVNQGPWKGAFPPEEHYLKPYVASIERQIEEELLRLK